MVLENMYLVITLNITSKVADDIAIVKLFFVVVVFLFTATSERE